MVSRKTTKADLKPACRACERCAVCRMPEDGWKKIEPRLRLTQYPAGFTLLAEGDEADRVYLICEGAVDVWTSDEDGHGLRFRWRRAQAGDLLGAVTVYTGMSSYLTTAETVTPCLIRIIPKAVFLRLLDDHRMIERQVFRYTGIEFYRLLGLHQDFVFIRSTQGRLARLLFRLYVEKKGSATGEEPMEIHMSRDELAERIGAAPETVSRALTQLVKKKIIKRRRFVTTIVDLDRLKSIK